MRILVTLPLALLVIGCGGSDKTTGTTGSAEPSKPAAAIVKIAGFKFGAPIRVAPGTTVTWVNKDRAPHTATGMGFDTGTLRRGEKASHKFTAAGTFDYVCQLHPYMHGTVTVT